MTPPEKCTQNLPQLRVSEALEKRLKDLAYAADRSVSEYVRLVLMRHVFGHAQSIGDQAEKVE